MNAGGTLAASAQFGLPSTHAVHIGTGASQIAQVSLEAGQLRHSFHLAHDAFPGTADNKLALMGGNGAESTSAETAPVNVDRKLYHVVGRDALVLVLGMRQSCIGKVEGTVQFFCGHRRIGRINHYRLSPCVLQDACSLPLVALLLYAAEIGRLFPLVFQASLVCKKADVCACFCHAVGQVGHLGYGAEVFPAGNAAGYLCHGLFAHAVDETVCPAIHQDTGA